ncbi:CocE/NonD family hydrolase [Eubacteriales bacterium OttesenSCG-928-K08]|nr:CocE/NonD family hydrolase [Eubacteriales bacterium OttesenSCG-928-K08]
MTKKLSETLGIDVLPNYWDKRYTKNLDQLSKPTYEVEQISDVFVTLRDGTRLCVDLYLPKGAGPCPALVSWAAYGKEMQYIKRGAIPPESLLFDHSLEAGDVDYFVSRGYVYIIPDPRGIGKSEGEFYGVYNPQEHEDIYDLIEWAAIQSWCDSNIGMIGYSYFGIIQILAAAQQPPHLKCIMPCSFVDDYYQHGYYGGVPNTYMSIYWELCPSNNPVPWSIKMYGEEKVKEMMAERLKDPDIAVNSYFNKILTTWPPKYHTFYLDYLLHPLDSEYWKQRSANQLYDKVKVPVYLHCAWSPLGRWSAPIFSAMQDERLACTKRLGVLEGYDGLELPYRALNEECLRWYDHWLKGIDTGFMDEPAYKFSVLNAGMRYENEWPLARTEWKKLYLRSFGRLRWDKEPDENLPPDGFTHMPPSVSTQVNKITYETSRFPYAMEFTGPIELHLWAAIDAEDANFVVKLYDVMPGGFKHPLLRYGALRASHPLDEARSTIGAPVHDNTVSIPVTPGEVREYVIEINPTSIVIPPGHQLELEITSMSPNECHKESWTGKVGNMNVVPRNETTSYRIYRDANHPSYLLMPLIPYTPDENWLQPITE